METLITSGQKRQIVNLIRDDTEKYLETLSIGIEPAQNVLKRGGELQAIVRVAIAKAIVELSGDPIAEWTNFYHEYLGLTVDLSKSKVVIPVNPGGFDWINIIAKELLEASNGRPHGFVIEAMRKNGIPVETYGNDLDSLLSPNISMIKNDQRKNDRWPDVSYAVRNCDRVEDEENKKFSADDLAKRNILGSTCLERLIHGYKYRVKTGKHLDIKNWTLCSGSRYSDGSVPCVFFSDVGVSVGWCSSSGAFSDFPARSVAV
jgi:hypothetical protein